MSGYTGLITSDRASQFGRGLFADESPAPTDGIELSEEEFASIRERISRYSDRIRSLRPDLDPDEK